MKQKRSEYTALIQTLSSLSNAILLHSRRLARSHDVTGLELACLRWIAAGQPLTYDELTVRLDLPQTVVIDLVAALEARKLIRTEACEAKDGDFFLKLRVTPKGMAIVATAPPSVVERLAQVFPTLAPEDRADIVDALLFLTSEMEEHPTENPSSAPAWPLPNGSS